jgi:hypothetical protein
MKHFPCFITAGIRDRKEDLNYLCFPKGVCAAEQVWALLVAGRSASFLFYARQVIMRFLSFYTDDPSKYPT